jgi:hypothetical protein
MSKPTVLTVFGAAMFAAAMVSAPATSSAQIVTGAPLPVMNVPPASETAPVFSNAELERILSPIALYPDPLLAQVLSAATFAQEIPAAARWVDNRRGRSAEQLVQLLAAEQVTWDPSVQALVAFPTVLQMMATSMQWTTEVGDAFRLQRADVMDAVQRLRAKAQDYGYLNSTSQLQVVRSPAIEILPVNPSYVVVPYYDPIVVFAPPRPRFLVSSAIYLGFGVHLGSWYEPWGWRTAGFYWPTRRIVLGYPGWNRPSYGYRPVYVDVRRNDPRYGYRPQGWDRDDRSRGNDGSRGRDSQRRDDNDRNGWSNRGGDNRGGDNRGNGNREASNTGRSAQPRQMPAPSAPPSIVRRVIERASAPEREVQRSSPQPSSRGNTSETRTARRRN